MRVIAGKARRIKLTAPEGMETRPTGDRAKEALFSIIGEKIRSASFLDLFCGSGAIAIEALSRGADSAVLVDASPAAIKSARQNLQKTQLTAKIIQKDINDALSELNMQIFDIIFADPPYDYPHTSRLSRRLIKNLSPGGMIIIETDAKTELDPLDLEEFQIQTRIYGREKFIFLTHKNL